MSLKITSGWSKGLKILTPEGPETRPTRGRVRESAINLIQPWIEGSLIVDLFAGSGAVGLELLSRGARGAVFVEKASNAIKCLDKNRQELLKRASQQQVDIETCDIRHSDVQIFLSKKHPLKFDIIWADPPYDAAKNFLELAIPMLKQIANPGAILALETSSEAMPMTIEASERHSITIEKQRRYGVSLITIWKLM